jgi:hypothetical protein
LVAATQQLKKRAVLVEHCQQGRWYTASDKFKAEAILIDKPHEKVAQGKSN